MLNGADAPVRMKSAFGVNAAAKPTWPPVEVVNTLGPFIDGNKFSLLKMVSPLAATHQTADTDAIKSHCFMDEKLVSVFIEAPTGSMISKLDFNPPVVLSMPKPF